MNVIFKLVILIKMDKKVNIIKEIVYLIMLFNMDGISYVWVFKLNLLKVRDYLKDFFICIDYLLNI